MVLNTAVSLTPRPILLLEPWTGTLGGPTGQYGVLHTQHSVRTEHTRWDQQTGPGWSPEGYQDYRDKKYGHQKYTQHPAWRSLRLCTLHPYGTEYGVLILVLDRNQLALVFCVSLQSEGQELRCRDVNWFLVPYCVAEVRGDNRLQRD